MRVKADENMFQREHDQARSWVIHPPASTGRRKLTFPVDRLSTKTPSLCFRKLRKPRWTAQDEGSATMSTRMTSTTRKGNTIAVRRMKGWQAGVWAAAVSTRIGV